VAWETVRAHVWRLSIRMSETASLDQAVQSYDGAARRDAREKRCNPKLRNDSCRQVFPSRVRDACGRHDTSRHNRRAAVSDDVQLSLCIGHFQDELSRVCASKKSQQGFGKSLKTFDDVLACL